MIYRSLEPSGHFGSYIQISTCTFAVGSTAIRIFADPDLTCSSTPTLRAGQPGR
jgi:hypothetical protein